MSIIIPSGYPYKAPKVFILDELEEFDKTLISTKNNKLKTPELKQWSSYTRMTLREAYGSGLDKLAANPPKIGLAKARKSKSRKRSKSKRNARSKSKRGKSKRGKSKRRKSKRGKSKRGKSKRKSESNQNSKTTDRDTLIALATSKLEAGENEFGKIINE
mmetsp:Transcript_6938/g.6106  ORF Transcript_6938/g.6106 Transcript_6938/m.6106 type:complete len:160 (-) Transcript_6938:398-877(-)